ncbi:MAG: DUF2914 domain-containing protein [Desulfobacterium sp.]|nr:DUF2914 domain-containing protein [Desulfobacterium sp.]
MTYMKPHRIKHFFLLALGMAVMLTAHADAQAPPPTLVYGTMCESIDNFHPVDPAVVFSISKGEIICFTTFDPVLEKTNVFHKWYKREQLISRARLTLQPPKWSSFSSMQLRKADKGPWRVEITDTNDNLLQTLRFSISD